MTSIENHHDNDYWEMVTIAVTLHDCPRRMANHITRLEAELRTRPGGVRLVDQLRREADYGVLELASIDDTECRRRHAVDGQGGSHEPTIIAGRV